jgi:subtilisin family serine protease
MKKLILTIFVIFSFTSALAQVQNQKTVLIDPALKNFIEANKSDQFVSVGVLLAEPNFANKPLKYQKLHVQNYLKQRTGYSMKIFRNELKNLNELGKNVFIKRAHWINNSVFVNVNAQGLKALTQISNVKKIYLNQKIKTEKPVYYQGTLPLQDPNQYPYDMIEIKLDKLISEHPEITGKGVLLGSVDTGVDGNHPALKGKIALFLDGSSRKVVEPYDSDTHGTHTIGTMVGGNRTDNLIGMAPDAKVIAAGALEGYDSMLYSMEWMLNPDGDNNTTTDLPKAVNCSWHAGGAPDMELFYKAIEAWEAAGILPVFSAGNDGPRDKTITHPKEHPLAFATAATGPNGKAANFSSRGPAQYHGVETQKPDLAAPGVDIYSTLPNGKYGKYSGTSMAAPHVTGSTALIAQVAPSLNPQQIRNVFLSTLTPVDVNTINYSFKENDIPPWNKVYGHGKLNVYEAVKLAMKVQSKLNSTFNSSILNFVGFFSVEDLQVNFIESQSKPQVFDPEQGFRIQSNEWLKSTELF